MGISPLVRAETRGRVPPVTATVQVRVRMGLVSSVKAYCSPQGKVADALRFAAAKIDAKVEAGMSEKTADIFMGGLKAIEADTADDDAKMIAISQVIGGIVNA